MNYRYLLQSFEFQGRNKNLEQAWDNIDNETQNIVVLFCVGV